jgi:hypothetical protein
MAVLRLAGGWSLERQNIRCKKGIKVCTINSAYCSAFTFWSRVLIQTVHIARWIAVSSLSLISCSPYSPVAGLAQTFSDGLHAEKPSSWDSILCRGKRVLSCPLRPERIWGPPDSYPMGTGVKRQRREDDHSPPSSAKVRNGGPVPPIPTRLHSFKN